MAALERQKIEDEYQECLKTIAYLQDLLAHPAKMLALIKEDVIRLRDKYGDERRTQIMLDARESFDEEELIQDKSVLISITERGYIKQTPSDAYKAQARGGRGASGMATKDDDEVIFLFSAKSHDTVLFFTDKGKVYALRAYQIPEADRAAKGIFLSNLILLAEGEKVRAALPISKDMMALARQTTDDGQLGSEAATTDENGEGADGAEENGEIAEVELESEAAEEQGSEGEEENESPISNLQSPISSSPTIAMCTRHGQN